MRVPAIGCLLVVCWSAVGALHAESAIKPATVTVGRNLQANTAVRLPQAAPEVGAQFTVTSDDPSRLLLSDAPDKPGSPTITVKVLPRYIESAEFWLQGLADAGTVTYTVSTAGVESAKGTVNLCPSGIVILGPLDLPKFPTTPRSADSKITVVSVALDSSLKVSAEQPIAGGTQAEVMVNNSNSTAGALGSSKLILAGGSSRVITYFRPAAEGDATMAPVQPPGFTKPAEMTSVIVSVAKPGLAIVGEAYVGKNLQLSAVLCLGETAPEGGLQVVLTSADPSKLLLSRQEDQLGSGSVTINVPAGQLTANYYIQGLGDSGEVTYEAVAPGFRSRTARIGLTPSGVIVAYERYGPPDEANVLRKAGTTDSREFFVTLAESKDQPLHVVAWTVHLDPESGRAADITVQPLRPGVTATVILKSSDPVVGTVESPVVIASGTNHIQSRFMPLSTGKTVITVNTPSGFTTPGNATSVPAIIN